MPLYLTIDKNSEIWLAHCRTHHDTDNDIEEFIFMYKSNPIPVQAIRCIYEQQVCWRITRKSIAQKSNALFLLQNIADCAII